MHKNLVKRNLLCKKKIIKYLGELQVFNFMTFVVVIICIVPSPLGSGGEWFLCHQLGRGCNCSTSRARVGTHSGGGGDDFKKSSRGDCFIMTNCWYFHQTLHLEFYKFRLRHYLNFFTTHHTVCVSINMLIIMYKAKETPYTIS